LSKAARLQALDIRSALNADYAAWLGGSGGYAHLARYIERCVSGRQAAQYDFQRSVGTEAEFMA
jgi:hypothetical protein